MTDTTIPTAEELAELAHDYANKYSYEGPWGVRSKSTSAKAWMENFAVEVKETRQTFFAAAVRDAVLDHLAAIGADICIIVGDKRQYSLADWIQMMREDGIGELVRQAAEESVHDLASLGFSTLLKGNPDPDESKEGITMTNHNLSFIDWYNDPRTQDKEKAISQLIEQARRLGYHAKTVEEKLVKVVNEANDNRDVPEEEIVSGEIEVSILRAWSAIEDGDIPDKWPT